MAILAPVRCCRTHKREAPMMPIDRGEQSTVSTNHRRAILVMVSAGARIMDALAAGCRAAQMIDTSVVRVRQHGAWIAGNNHQVMGRSRGGLTSEIARW
jgi:hypothetical protein